ncbi:hypothetical protein NDU88_000573 [Pleurodeles waltl]|uniref:Uncharacterized protein n=1 Tax=Pleurodeles waltl TaxID=8319 RepID=A0AAV7VV55_PLEWA|nr:hypothetical protein NDU88_000573 [Pleurodeles waltl]
MVAAAHHCCVLGLTTSRGMLTEEATRCGQALEPLPTLNYFRTSRDPHTIQSEGVCIKEVMDVRRTLEHDLGESEARLAELYRYPDLQTDIIMQRIRASEGLATQMEHLQRIKFTARAERVHQEWDKDR